MMVGTAPLVSGPSPPVVTASSGAAAGHFLPALLVTVVFGWLFA